MTFGIFLLTIIAGIWFLLVRGWLWKILLGLGGWFGIRYFLMTNITESAHTCCNVMGQELSYASTVAIFILIMAAAYTKEQ